MEQRMKSLEERVCKLEELEERRQRNLQELIQKQIESEKKRQKIKSTFH